jgi:hypothetical protein
VKTFRQILEFIPASQSYALTGSDNIVIAKGNKKEMHKLRKEKGSGYRVWDAPASKVGDKLR